MLCFHTQTAGVALTAQQPEVNLIRVTAQAIAAILGGTSLHTNAYDEAIALPTEKAARLALRTQQVLAYETDLTSTVDPFAGSYAVEAMTDEVEAVAVALIEQVDSLGGAVDSARARLAALRSSRSSVAVERSRDELRKAAKDPGSNVLYPMNKALAAHATVGEVCHAVRDVWGT